MRSILDRFDNISMIIKIHMYLRMMVIYILVYTWMNLKMLSPEFKSSLVLGYHDDVDENNHVKAQSSVI